MADRVELGSVVYRILFETGGADQAVKSIQSSFDELTKNTKKVSDELGSGLKKSGQEFGSALSAVGQQTKSAAAGLTQFGGETKKVGGALDDVGKKLLGTGSGFGRFKQAVLSGLGIGTGFTVVQQAISGIKNAISGTINAAVSFESAFAGIRKTVDASEAEFAQLSDSIRQMAKEIPISVEELSRIGELGGQLGVGIQDMEKFIKTVGMIGVTTNLSIEDASTAFARISNVMGEPLQNIDRMASAVVALGNNFATQETEIVAFANRLAKTGKQIGLSTSDIFGLAAAMKSVGLQTEAGSTAISKAMSEIEKSVVTGSKKLNDFATIAGMTATDFKAMWESSPAQAFSQFVKGIKASGDKAIPIIESMFGAEFRLRDALLATANAHGILDDALNMSSEEFKKNLALQIEAQKRFETTESKIKLQKQAINNLAISVGDGLKGAYLKVLESLAKVLAKVVDFINWMQQHKDAVIAVTKAIVTVGGLVFAYNSIIKTSATLIKTFNAVKTAMAATQASSTLMKVALLSVPTSLVIGVSIIGLALVFDRIAKLKTALNEASESADNLSKISSKSMAVAGKLKESPDEEIKKYAELMEKREQANQQLADLTKKGSTFFNTLTHFMPASPGKEIDKQKSDVLAQVDDLNRQLTAQEAKIGSDRLQKAKKNAQKEANIFADMQDVKTEGGVEFANTYEKAIASAEDSIIGDMYEEMDAFNDLINQKTQGNGEMSASDKKRLEDLKLLGGEIDKHINLIARIANAQEDVKKTAESSGNVQVEQWNNVFLALADTKSELDDLDKVYSESKDSIEADLAVLEKNHKSVKTAIDEIIGSTEEYKETASDTNDVVAAYERIQDAVKKASDTIKQLRNDIAGIDKDLLENTEDFKQSIAKKVAEAEKEIENLRGKLNDSNISVDTRSDIEQQIRDQQALIDAARNTEIDYTAELQKARQEANMNEVELLIAKFEEEKARLEEQKQLKEEQLEAELAKLTEIKEQENNVYEKHKEFVNNMEKLITDTYLANLNTRLGALTQYRDSSVKLYMEIAKAAKAAREQGADLDLLTRFEGVDLNELKTANEQKIANITNNITLNANVNSELDMKLLLQKASEQIKEQYAQ